MLKVYSRNLGDVAILSLQGRVISGETRSLRDAVRSQSNVSAIVLDLARVTAIDARGLGVMLELQRQTALEGIRFKLMNVNKFTSRVLEVTRLDSVFEIIPKAEPAMSPRTAPARTPIAACA
jgi:anti-anti-sigma factor